jgi:hypothetical protein
MPQRITIASHQLGLHYRDGDFVALLRPGAHWIWGAPRRNTVKVLSRLAPRLDLPDAEILAARPEVAAVLDSYRIKDTERGLLFKGDNFAGILGPGFHAILRTEPAHRVEILPTTPEELRHPLLHVIVRHPDAAIYLQGVDVPAGHKGLLYRDQALHKVLPPGRTYYFRGVAELLLHNVDVREQLLEIQGQELMTQDKVSLRINLSARIQIADPVLATSSQSSYRDAVYRELQLALRDEVGGRALDDLLARKEEVGAAIAARARPALEAMGVKLLVSGLRDIILPGEMRQILNQVIEAEKRAQANMIARREETAATRNLMNTAKLLENNPLLMRLKELESSERIAEKIGSLSVYGGLDGLLATLRGMTRLSG